MLLTFAVSKQENDKDYPWVETQVNWALGQINVTMVVSDAQQDNKSVPWGFQASEVTGWWFFNSSESTFGFMVKK